MAGSPSKRPVNRGVSVPILVRWGDMDAFGHVNNTVYFRFFESSRIAYLESMGVNLDRKRETTGPGLVAAHVNFRRQIRYPATLTATANVTAVSQRSITFEHVLRDPADDRIVADGSAVCVWMDYVKEKALSLPHDLVEAIKRIEAKPGLKRAKAHHRNRKRRVI